MTDGDHDHGDDDRSGGDVHAPFETMPVHDEFLPEETYTEFVERMPQTCVELVLETDAGLLLAKRTIHPRVWFWPGSRLYKGESLEAAAHRVASEELGIEVSLVEQLGVDTHFWQASVDGAPSRHTVNVVYRAVPAHEEFAVDLDDDHSTYRFLSTLEPDLHEYVRMYVREYDLL